MGTISAVSSREEQVLEDLRTGVELAWRLPWYLRRRVDLTATGDQVRRRLERRPDDFLRLARRAVFGPSRTPYRELLNHVGCELGDSSGWSSTRAWRGRWPRYCARVST